MNIDEKAPKKSNVSKWIALFVVLIAVWAAWFYFGGSISSRISKVLASTDSNPVPTTKLEKQPFSLTVSADGEVVGLETTPVATPNTSSGQLTIAWLIPEGSFVNEGDPVVRFDNTDTKLNLERRQNTLDANQQNTKIKTLQQGTEDKTMDLDLRSAEEDYQYAVTVMPQDESIFSKWDIITKQSDVHYNKENLEFLKSKVKTQKRVARSEQQVLAIERNKAENEVAIYQRTMNSLELSAPVGGLVLYRRDRREEPKVGNNSFPGQVIVEIINLDALQARIYMLERDGGNLEKDLPVNIKLDAIPDKTYHGTIRTVSSVAASLERDSPLRYFTCDVTISDAGRDLKQIRPGMNLRGDVVLHEYESCFVVPSGAVTTKDSQTDNIVYVKNGDRFEPRVVETGLSSHGEAVITSGVEEGEVIALADPNGTRKLALPDFNKGSDQQPMRGPGGGGMPMMPPGGMMGGGRR
ncbi:MAG: HlyD family efflux transporter periplasmic adaptor subunit [Acidobacteriota bacterium]|jgi:HlyD family secretion protein|nr:HlyD family efflux transporter periplasmic adaptor subunit [Acidobacteriota bacterium]